MNQKEFERMRAEVEEEQYREWEMKQPGYWTGQAIGALLAIVIFLGGYVAVVSIFGK